MKVKGMIADVQVTSTPDLKDKKVKFNFLTKTPLEVHEVHLSKDMANAGYEGYFIKLAEKEQELELAIQLKNIKFQPDPNKPMIDLTKFELFQLPKELESIIADETKRASVAAASKAA